MLYLNLIIAQTTKLQNGMIEVILPCLIHVLWYYILQSQGGEKGARHDYGKGKSE
jgi:hypothetical protein